MSEPCTVGPGRGKLPPPGGNRMPHLLGPEVPSYNTIRQLLDRVYITEARRTEECEEGSGGPDRDDRGRLTD